ncbi:complex I subunit 1/NuoH family protein [Bryobacter aggregatus]|uniref:complex I subunit 1/NuoH family protein n=1 Tax=Bryobacter aggregatus TaxID=360054 RepID=UPI0004E28200|nr:complex I subunit 1 family protein [Bryobacter aggregatus]
MNEILTGYFPYLMALGFAAAFPLVVGYLVLVERKLLADFQARLGPMRVGPHGLLQPLADALKLLLKEDIVPVEADRGLFYLGPVISLCTAFAAFAVVPITKFLNISDVNVGLLFISAMAAVGVFGLILGGWSSNSNYALLGALRAAAQLISYEVAMGLALVCVVMMSGTLSLVGIVEAQQRLGVWFVFGNYGGMLLAFFIFLIAAVAEINRAPFDLPEAESEIVAGYHTEYSGFRWALYMLAEYTNIVIVCCVAVTLFFGGWLRPFPNVAWLAWPMEALVPLLLFGLCAYGCFRMKLLPFTVLFALAGLVFLIPVMNQLLSGPFWFFLKASGVFYVLVWFRASWPRLRYDQLMDLGWKRLIPLGLACLLGNAIVGMI